MDGFFIIMTIIFIAIGIFRGNEYKELAEDERYSGIDIRILKRYTWANVFGCAFIGIVNDINLINSHYRVSPKIVRISGLTFMLILILLLVYTKRLKIKYKLPW